MHFNLQLTESTLKKGWQKYRVLRVFVNETQRHPIVDVIVIPYMLRWETAALIISSQMNNLQTSACMVLLQDW